MIEPRIADWQVFVSPRVRSAVEVLDDSHALGIHRGDWLIVEPVSRYEGDAVYLLQSGEVVQMQAMSGGINIVRGDGPQEIVTIIEASQMVAGIMHTLAKSAPRAKKTA